MDMDIQLVENGYNWEGASMSVEGGAWSRWTVAAQGVAAFQGSYGLSVGDATARLMRASDPDLRPLWVQESQAGPGASWLHFDGCAAYGVVVPLDAAAVADALPAGFEAAMSTREVSHLTWEETSAAVEGEVTVL